MEAGQEAKIRYKQLQYHPAPNVPINLDLLRTMKPSYYCHKRTVTNCENHERVGEIVNSNANMEGTILHHFDFFFSFTYWHRGT